MTLRTIHPPGVARVGSTVTVIVAVPPLWSTHAVPPTLIRWWSAWIAAIAAAVPTSESCWYAVLQSDGVSPPAPTTGPAAAVALATEQGVAARRQARTSARV